MIKCIIKFVRNGESQINYDKDVLNFILEYYYLYREKNYFVRYYNVINCDFFSDKFFDIVYIFGIIEEQYEGYKRTYRNICIYMYIEKQVKNCCFLKESFF